MFVKEYHDLVEKTKVTSGDSGFHSEKSMQEIAGALDHLALAEEADNDIITKITEAV